MAQIVAISMDRHLETPTKKSHILLSQIGSKILDARTKENFKTKILTIGAMMVANSKIKPASPTEFFISILLVKIKLSPSARYEPTNGI